MSDIDYCIDRCCFLFCSFLRMLIVFVLVDDSFFFLPFFCDRYGCIEQIYKNIYLTKNTFSFQMNLGEILPHSRVLIEKQIFYKGYRIFR
jgi:hypothetical protein